MVRKIYWIIFILLATTIVFGGLKPVKAQSIGIRISPTIIDEPVDPGELLQSAVTVTNESDTPRTLYAYLRDFKAEGETGQAVLIPPGSESGYYLASWIDITDQALEFAPGEQKTIPFAVHVPDDVGPGGYYGAILFGTEPPRLFLENGDKGAGMAVAQQAGSLLLLQVKGEANESASIREFTTDKGVYGTPFDVNFQIRIQNSGNVHVKPRGSIIIKNMFGKEVGRIMVNDDAANVLPNSIRRFESEWQGGTGFGRYSAELGLSFGTSADLGGSGKQSIFGGLYFWIMPWRIIIPVLLVLVIITALAVLMLRLYRNKAVRRAMEQAGLGRVRYVKKFQGPSPALHLGVILLVVFIALLLIMSFVYFVFFA